jgi:ribosomal protein L37AE/L43A
VSLILVGMAGIGITRGILRHYHCPCCDDNLIGRTGLQLFLSICPHCGAKLG